MPTLNQDFVTAGKLNLISQFSWSVVSDSVQPHELQHARPPSLPPTPRVHPNPCPLSRWCHPTITSSVVPFSFCPQSFPESGSFSVSQLFVSSGQNTGPSTLASVLPMNIQSWFPLTGLIFLLSKGLQRVFSSTTVWKHQFFNSHICKWLLEIPQLWLYGPLSAKWCLCFLAHYLGLS